jgi:GxxExxY protein
MGTNDTNNTNTGERKLIYKDLSYTIVGAFISAHNELGPYAREKQYGDVVARIFKEKEMYFDREVKIGDSGNTADGIVEHKVLVEFKAKRILTPEDYYQTQRYLQETGLRLAILVNFRDKYIKPRRIVRIENWKKPH